MDPIAKSIQSLQRLDGTLKHALTALPVGLALLKVRQRTNHFDAMEGQKLRQVFLSLQEQNGQVTPIHDMPFQATSLLNQPAKIGVQFWRTSGDVNL
jgi:hypothetical protein